MLNVARNLPTQMCQTQHKRSHLQSNLQWECSKTIAIQTISEELQLSERTLIFTLSIYLIREAIACCFACHVRSASSSRRRISLFLALSRAVSLHASFGVGSAPARRSSRATSSRELRLAQ